MAEKTGIEWCDSTWPIVQGCDRVSQGCVHCYAVPLLWRMAHDPDPHISEPVKGLVERYTPADGEPILRFTGKLALREDRLTWPLQWKKPRMIFVPSHGDLFHKDVPDDFIDKVFAVMALCPQHTFQVLTKRAERMREYCANDATLGRVVSLTNSWLRENGSCTVMHKDDGLPGLVLPNVWLGVSCEDQKNADERIPHLLQTPAAIRFVSAEPLLGPITFSYLEWARLDWVIDGGESGSDAREYDIDASRKMERECVRAGIAYFRKQLGARPFEHNVSDWPDHIAIGGDARRAVVRGFKDKKAGDPSEWPEDLRRREIPEGGRMTRAPDLFGFDAPASSQQDIKTIELTLAIHGDVGASIKVSETGDEHRSVLLPKSLITITPTGKTTSKPGYPKYAIADVVMPEWLAKDRELV